VTLLHPWWLLALPLWPLLLFFLRARDQKRLVPAPDFLLWQRAAARLPRPAAAARFSWRDLLWIAPPVLLTIGLAAPEQSAPASSTPVAVLVDASASMEAKGADGSRRMDRGIAEATRLAGGRPADLERVATAKLAETAVLLQAAGRPVVVVTDRTLGDLPLEVGVVQVVDDAKNAGIVGAGFDPEAGLLVRVESDPGAGPRTLSVTADDRVVDSRALPEPASARVVLPASAVAGAATVVVRLDPPDALPADDVVTLVRAEGAVLVAIASTAPPSLEKALRAVPGVEVARGAEEGDLVVLVAPVAKIAGFETGAPAPREGAIAGRSGFDGLTGPASWKALFPLVGAPSGTETLLDVGGAPLLVRKGKTFVLLADPGASGWASLPGFPLAIARVVEAGAAGGRGRLEPRLPAVLSPEATHVARSGAPVSRAPVVRDAPPPRRDLARWIYAAAAALMLVVALVTRR
jgi:hypothetical protein